MCRSRDVLGDDFGSDLTLHWRKEVISDSPTIRERKEWRGTGGNTGGFRSMTHEFTATTSPAFVSVFYVRSNSNRFPLVIEHGIDNWRVEICR